MRKAILLLFTVLLYSIQIQAQHIDRKGFTAPFDFSLYLSGNFGELRSNHFHGGLDFKTQHQSGKKLLALHDGYISRVQVSHGSGYVLHTVYDNGFSTISRHLIGFVGAVAHLVDSIQYAQESWEMDLKFKPYEHPIKQGQHIAYSGNLGYSFAPHLHLDVYETASGVNVDPLPFFSHLLADSRPPKAYSYLFVPQEGKGIINGSTKISTRDVSMKTPVSAWGLIGVGIKALDYMDGVTNNYGVKYMKVYLDGDLVFESNVDYFSDAENRYINSWTYKKHMKAFIEPGNRLGMLKAHNGQRGLIDIREERLYELKFVLTDYYKNSSTYTLNIQGSKQEIPQQSLAAKEILKWNRAQVYSRSGLDLWLPTHCLYDDVYLDFKTSIDPSTHALVYQLIAPHKYVPLHSYADLVLRVTDLKNVSSDKLYVAKQTSQGKWSSVGGRYQDGFMHTKIRELGTFTVLSDTIAPRVTAVQPHLWAKKGEVVFSAVDKETGIKSYRGTIDGEYALFYLDIMPKKIRYKIDSNRIERGKQHKVELVVEDHAKNRTFITEQFFW